MRIGIDIDDTVAKTDEFIEEFLTNRNYDMEKINSLMLRFKTYIEDFGEDSVLNIPTYNESVNMINKLKKRGDEIYFLTSRNKKALEYPYEVTEKWLIANGILFNKLIVDCGDKGKTCIDNNIDFFIDNDLKHINRVKEVGIKTLLFTGEDLNEYNTMSDWSELPKILEEQWIED